MKKRIILITLAVIAAALILWTVWGNLTVGVTHFTVTSDRLPADFDRCRIAVVSDLHNAEFGENNRDLIGLIETAKPAIIAITGDLVDARHTRIEVARRLVQELVKIAPCYYVTGNHEAALEEQYAELEQTLQDAGVTILHNRAVPITRNGETIQLVGLDDPYYMDRMEKTPTDELLKAGLEEAELTADYCILLSHRPEAFGTYVATGVDLALCGHAHGGQFRLPFVGGLFAPGQGWFPRYDAGEYVQEHTHMIVSRGIGNSGLPIRFNNRPEIVVIALRCAG